MVECYGMHPRFGVEAKSDDQAWNLIVQRDVILACQPGTALPIATSRLVSLRKRPRLAAL